MLAGKPQAFGIDYDFSEGLGQTRNLTFEIIKFFLYRNAFFVNLQ
jgi:hypothetical protein